MKITPITVAVKHLHHKASDLAHEVRKKAGRAAIELAGSKSAPGFFRNMVLEKIQNRWSDVREQFQLHASQSPKPPITEQLVLKAYKATIDEWSVRDPGQPLCGPELTLEVNRKLLTFLNNCPANTRIAIEKLLSMDAVHARAMKDMSDAISADKYASTDMLLKDVKTIVEKAPPSNHRDVPPEVLLAGILVPLPLAPEMKLGLMRVLIPDWQDGYSSDEKSLQGPTSGSSRGSTSSQGSTSSRGSVTSSTVNAAPATLIEDIVARPPPSPEMQAGLTLAGQDGGSTHEGSFRGSSIGSSRGSTTSSQYFSFLDSTDSEDDDALTSVQTSSTMPTKKWLNKQVAFIERRVDAGIQGTKEHATRLNNDARELELYKNVPFDTSIHQLGKALEGKGPLVQEYAKDLFTGAISRNSEETKAFRFAIFNGWNSELVKKIDALPNKVAAAPDNTAAVLREEVEQIVMEVRSLPYARRTGAAVSNDVVLLELARLYQARGSSREVATSDLVKKIRLQ